MERQTQHVVIIGAGYAGLLATVRLAGKVRHHIERGQVAVTLVNASDMFVERLRLHQLAAGRPIRHRPIPDILRGTGVAFVRGEVTRLDAAQRRVAVQTDAGAQSIQYDHLMVALGSTIDQDSVPGVREHGFVLAPSGPRSAMALRQALPSLNVNPRGGRLVVCGGGATGIEAAAEFAESYPGLHVQLVTRGEFGQFMNPRVADYMRHALDRLGVTIRDDTAITEVRANEVRTADGARLPHDVCVWTGGFTVPALAREAGLAVNQRGQVLIDPFMRSISHPDIYAVGDAAHPAESPGVRVRMAAYTAVVMGAHGADCVAARLQGRPPRPFGFAYAGQAIALGQRDAIGFALQARRSTLPPPSAAQPAAPQQDPDDVPHAPYFTGRTGVTVREFFVRLLADLPNIERRWPGFFTWMGKGRTATSVRQERVIASIAPQPDPSAWSHGQDGE